MTPATPLSDDFTTAIAGLTGHIQMDGFYQSLSQLSDLISALQCQPKFEDMPAADDALQSLDNFLMDQVDAIHRRAIEIKPRTWHEWEARAVLLLKHAARFRLDIGDIYAVCDALRDETAPAPEI